MSKWRKVLVLSLGVLGYQLSPAWAAELTLWDFNLTYAMDDEGVPVSYQVDGLYSHKIECTTDWELVSSVSAPIANPAHVVMYKGSYSEGLFRVVESKDGTQTSTTVRCPSYNLVANEAVAGGWNLVCRTSPCNATSSRLFQGIAPAQTGPASTPTPQVSSSACICASAAQTSNLGTIPFTGRVYGALDIPGTAGIYRYALTGNMVGGVNWDSSSSGQPNSVPFPAQFLALVQIRPPFGAGVAVGSWRVWWNGN